MGPHRPRLGSISAAVAGLLLVTAGVGARPSFGIRARGSVPGLADSAAVEAAARRDQARFERERRRRLPVRRVAYGPCPERVGRFCHWFEDDGIEPRPEPASIAPLRRRLLDRLDSAFVRLPGSRWISGQVVRYGIEAGRPADALVAARACRTSRAWCSRLAGMALHALGRERQAEEAFEVADRAASPTERCRSSDLGDLLEGEVRAHYERLPCPGPARRVFERRYWWLADPLYLEPGNERRVEDRVRRLTSELEADAASPYDVRWGEDLSELTIRYGWPAWWERVPGDPLRPGDLDSWIAHDPPHGLSFVPRADPLTPPGDLTPEAWRPTDPRPRSRYAPAYADTFVRLPSRTIAFRRGDSVLVLAAYALPGPMPPARRPSSSRADGTADIAALLLLAGGPDEPYGRQALEPALRSGVLSARAPARALLESVEALDRRRRVAARLRRGVDLRRPPEGTPAISGLLAGPAMRAPLSPETPSGSLPVADADPLGVAARLVLAGPGPAAAPVARPGESLELYWELYGLPSGGGVRVEITLREDDARSFDPVDPKPPSRSRPRVRLAWTAEPSAGAFLRPYREALSLPRSIPDGVYAVEVRARAPGWTTLVSRAPILIRAAGSTESQKLHP
ncbi:MAG: hypothetical protein Q8W49_07145 [Candidatus Palauibacterales bacterium]|nr:hypothetical protein [Candidatus Palauibacterales bacterium]